MVWKIKLKNSRNIGVVIGLLLILLIRLYCQVKDYTPKMKDG